MVDTAVLGVRDRAQRARLNLDIRIAEDAVEFIADEARVRQVLYNLAFQRHRLLQARRHDHCDRPARGRA